MPKSLAKVSKKITNKRKHAGKASAMHEHSRDSRRLQRAAARDTRLVKTLDSRSRQNMPYRTTSPCPCACTFRAQQSLPAASPRRHSCPPAAQGFRPGEAGHGFQIRYQ